MVVKELYRQAIHIIFGTLVAFSLLYIGKTQLILPLFIIIVIGIILYYYLKEHSIPIISDLLEMCSRDKEHGKGAILFAIGLLLTLIIVEDINSAFYSILVFSIGDGFATLIGVRGKHEIKYFGKTVEGFLAFFISACIILYFPYKLYGIAVAFIGACIELVSRKIKIDDNLLLPIVIAIILELVPHIKN